VDRRGLPVLPTPFACSAWSAPPGCRAPFCRLPPARCAPFGDRKSPSLSELGPAESAAPLADAQPVP
jgi:hypothetical protein